METDINNNLKNYIREAVRNCTLCTDIDRSGAHCINSKEIGNNIRNNKIIIAFNTGGRQNLIHKFTFATSEFSTKYCSWDSKERVYIIYTARGSPLR